MNQDLLKLLKEKEKNVETEKEQQRIDFLKESLKKEDFFININYDTAIKILKYLGVPEDEIISKYFELISIDRFKECDINPKIIFKS